MSTQHDSLITVNMFGLFSSFTKTNQVKFSFSEPTSLEQVIFKLDSSCASGLYKECFEDGKVKEGIFILVNGHNVTQDSATTIESGSIITFMTAISGG